MTDAKGDIDAFIETWAASGGGERSNYQLFLTQLCDLLGVPQPERAVEDSHVNEFP